MATSSSPAERAVTDRLDSGFLDVLRRIEIRLAGAKADDVAAGRFQLARLVGDGDGGGRLDARERVGEEGHFSGSGKKNGRDRSGRPRRMQARCADPSISGIDATSAGGP
ncbi:MAG: hypothetical protein ACTHOL_05505, partial [Luteibacter jiangsuensis]